MKPSPASLSNLRPQSSAWHTKPSVAARFPEKLIPLLREVAIALDPLGGEGCTVRVILPGGEFRDFSGPTAAPSPPEEPLPPTAEATKKPRGKKRSPAPEVVKEERKPRAKKRSPAPEVVQNTAPEVAQNTAPEVVQYQVGDRCTLEVTNHKGESKVVRGAIVETYPNEEQIGVRLSVEGVGFLAKHKHDIEHLVGEVKFPVSIVREHFPYTPPD